jgi:DNA-binding NarL/FixJ family response regulator
MHALIGSKDRCNRCASHHSYRNCAVRATCNANPQSLCDADCLALRCLIVDDSPRFLRAARALLEQEGASIVGTARASAEALRQADALHPDVVLVDVSLGDESGFELSSRLVAAHGRELPVILISTHAEADLADLIASSPAAGFLSKSELSFGAVRDLLGSA